MSCLWRRPMMVVITCMVLIMFKNQYVNAMACNLDTIQYDTLQIQHENCGITSFQYEFPHALFISLDGNKLSKVPTIFHKYHHIISLSLANNQIKDIPKDIHFPYIEHLNLQGNPLSSMIIHNISSLPQLDTLDLQYCNLSTIDGYLPLSLTSLQLRGNKFNSIPNIIFGLPLLQDLSLEIDSRRTPELTVAQFNFLSKIHRLYMPNLPKVPSQCNHAQESRLLQNVGYVCVHSTYFTRALRVLASENSVESGNQSVFLIVVVILLIFLVIILFTWLWYAVLRQPLLGVDMEEHINGTPLDIPISSFYPYQSPFDVSKQLNSVSTPRASHNQSSDGQAASCLSAFATLKKHRLASYDINVLKIVSPGIYTVVYLAQYKKRYTYACKRISGTTAVDLLQSQKQCEAFNNEITYVASLRHENIVNFFGLEWNSRQIDLFFEYMAGGDLHDCLALSKESPLGIRAPIPCGWHNLKIGIIQDVATAIEYIYALDRSKRQHRSIKAENILLSGTYEVAKICDFDISKILPQPKIPLSTQRDGRWLAPEVLSGSAGYSKSTAIYSLGMVLLELDSHEIPLDSVNNQENEPLRETAILCRLCAREIDPLTLFSKRAEEIGIVDIARKCLDWEPNDRISTKDLMIELNAIREKLQKFPVESLQPKSVQRNSVAKEMRF